MVRAMVARRLTEEGWRQTRISKKLFISQAMVSKYLSGSYPMEPFDEAEHLASELTSLIIREADHSSITGLVCQWCFSLKEKGHLCQNHPVEHCSVCMNLRSMEEVGERHTVLSDIEDAIRLMSGVNMEPISPQVRINIAQAISGAENTMDVASIPGRLIPVGDGMKTLAPPEFGVSRHLAGILLSSMKSNPKFRAVMNIRFDSRVKEALRKSKLITVILDRTRYDDLETFMDSGEWDDTEVFVDPGDFGIEPCTYLLGEDAPHAVGKTLLILDFITTKD